MLEDAAGEELVGHLRDDGTPRAVRAREALVVHRLQVVEMILHQPKQRRRLGASGLVDAALIVRDRPAFATGPHRYDQLRFRDIDSDQHTSLRR